MYIYSLTPDPVLCGLATAAWGFMQISTSLLLTVLEKQEDEVNVKNSAVKSILVVTGEFYCHKYT